MSNVLRMKLEQFTRFSEAERARLDRLVELPRKTYAAGDAIFEEGAKVNSVYLIVEGVAARRKTLPNGERQTMGFLIPGDLCELEVFVLSSMARAAETGCLLRVELSASGAH